MGWRISYDDNRYCVDFRNANFIEVAQRASKYLIIIYYNNSSALTMKFDSKEERDYVYALIRESIQINAKTLPRLLWLAIVGLGIALALFMRIVV